ncbi:nuclear transport factor 2 family protein [Nocardia sp. NPDC051030]|uniref:nuclear transport factor 2 family protein n=1 Tax=Nocardia sp. NPDC051030 TaxID=3155162 RepID=UPI00342990F8
MTEAHMTNPHTPTKKWSKEEIEDALIDFIEDSTTTWVSGDIAAWADWYAEDAVFRDLGMGYESGVELHGRTAIREQYIKNRDHFPGGQVQYYPCPWYIIDEDRGLVLMEWRCRMTDPGDGSLHEEPCYTRLIYGGDRQWSFEEDIYNPVRMGEMIERWLAIYVEHHPGPLPEKSSLAL